MAGPWEQYAATDAGPWSKYAAPEATPAPKSELTTSDLLRLATPDMGKATQGLLRGFNRVVGTVGGVAEKVLPDLPQYRQQREQFDTFNSDMDKRNEGSAAYQAGDVAGQVVTTAPVGAALAVPARALGMTRFGNALASSGMKTGAAVAPNLAARAGDMGIRMAGGGATGAASAGLIDPEFAETGGAIGALLPPLAKVAGVAGKSIGRVINGPVVPENILARVEAARQAGYVIPPTQAKPTLVNRLLEGSAGKITTAQNASAKNQPVTNLLAQRSIGAADLTPESIQAVRRTANAAYDELASVGQFQADDAFRTALQSAAGNKALPGIANKEVDALVEALSGQGMLDAQQTIESIKRLRFDGSGNKGAADPVKRALGTAQMKVAGALEDLIDRNLKGAPELLANYRAARTTLAKVHDVEKALSGGANVDAVKIAALLKKGRPLTDDLRTIADFAGQFPKAAQLPERMGSLPQVSPVDLWGAGIAGSVTGNPLAMAAPLLRPGARSLALSPAVQNRLVSPANTAQRNLLSDPALEMLFRAAPVLAADR